MVDLKSILAPAPPGWQVEILYKSIRHIYFRIYPGKKRVKITAPRGIPSSDLEAAVHAKSPWLLKKIKEPVPVGGPGNPLTAGDNCGFKGQVFPLIFTERSAPPRVEFYPEKGIVIQTRPGATREKKADVLSGWLRQSLKQEIRILLDRWEPVMGVHAADFGVKKMKTRWGSCNTRARRIWINLALIRLSPGLLEYVLVHELAHLIEPSHNPGFYLLMDRFLPGWKTRRAELDKYSPMG